MAKITTVADKAKQIETVLSGMALEGLSLRKACLKAGVARPTFLLWCDGDAVLADRYTRARDELIDGIADEILLIADGPVNSTDSGATDSGAVNKQRLQIESRKWLLSKLAPKKYGDKLELSGDSENPLLFSRIERVVIKNG